LQGIGGGALLSTSQAILFEAFPLSERGLASGIFGMGIVIGPTIGPTLGGFIVDQLSWPWIFYVNLPVGILATLLAFRFVPDPKLAKPTRIDWAGIALLIVGIGSLQTVLERGQTEDWFSKPYIAALSLLSAICLSTFVVWELWVTQPVVNLRVLKSKTLAVAAILTFVLGFGMFVSVFTVPVFAQRLLNFTATQTGLLLLPSAITAAILLPFIGRMVGQGASPKPMIVFGFCCFILFGFTMSHFDLSSGRGDFFWPLMFRGLGIATLTVPLTVLAVSDLKGADIPQGAAMNNMMRQLGGSFGIAAINTYVAQRAGSHRLDLVTHLGLEDSATLARLDAFVHRFGTLTADTVRAQSQAYQALEGIIARQTFLLTYLDSFRVVALTFFACLPLILLVGKRQAAAGPIAIPESH
jgi:MFS transporter, DHA2 family, multidrug resistance protein